MTGKPSALPNIPKRPSSKTNDRAGLRSQGSACSFREELQRAGEPYGALATTENGRQFAPQPASSFRELAEVGAYFCEHVAMGADILDERTSVELHRVPKALPSLERQLCTP